ncbi:MAG: M48 family metallopeptidase [Desulfobacterales bacterium]
MPSDMESLRFSYESRLFRAISARFGPVPLMDYDKSRQFLEARRRDLLGDAVRVTEELLPDIHAIYRHCLDVLGGEIEGDLFVRQSPEYNASVFAHDRRFDILIHSALINDFSGEELGFVFGHELGHVVFQHSQFPVRDLYPLVKDRDPEGSVLLLRWSQAAEVSADRVGMMCCGQLGAAATALFRTASGLRGIDANSALHSFRNQYAELETRLRSASDRTAWIRTHPMIPIRFKAIELAALDLIALGKGTGGFSEKGFRRIDQQIAATLEALEIQPFFPH